MVGVENAALRILTEGHIVNAAVDLKSMFGGVRGPGASRVTGRGFNAYYNRCVLQYYKTDVLTIIVWMSCMSGLVYNMCVSEPLHPRRLSGA